ncbi:MAG TPA: hypothetical protein VJ792_06730 [Candidatus Nitrosotalea sp.]|nr:hypothetical protein [Candidatus Nitrosotalea sp.]
MSNTDQTVPLNEQVTRIKSIKFFTPARTMEETNSLLPKVDSLIEEYAKALSPWKQEGMSLQHASDSLWDLARVYAMKSGVVNTWDSAWDYAWKEAGYSARDNYGWYGGGYASGETARDAARDAAKYAARYIAYESAKEKLQNPNPFVQVIELYSMGLKPTYFRKVDDQERFVVDVPLKIGGKFVLGCYVQGDGEILFMHNWREYCSGLAPVKADGSSRNIA